jgi:predicted MFS family arabinose efflux permease
MGFHDRLASKAYIDGHTSREFAGAAQRNANAFWFFAVITAVVSWFASWKWATVPAVLAAWSAVQSISATMIQTRIEKSEARDSLYALVNTSREAPGAREV